MVELIITEKPSSAQKVAYALADTKPAHKKEKQSSYYELKHKGRNIIVTSAVGHLYGLVEKNKAGWNYPVFEVQWAPSYIESEGLKYVKDYIDLIANLSKKAEDFTIACDYDVEGEVIGLNIIRFACKKKDANRMKFSTLTKEDLVEAYDHKMKHLDWGQAHAGETRHILDWFYGINLSRALTSSVKAAGSFKVMSAGRVQGPALKLLVDREREISAFKPEPFWQLSLKGSYKSSAIEAWHEKDKFTELKEVEKILHSIKNEKDAVIKEIKKTKREQLPPNPFDLTTLQSESYLQFKITPKETLAIAQNLYLAGVTSYPRTSSQQLDPKLGFRKIFNDLSRQPEYEKMCKELLKLPQLNPNNGKKTDPAHPAIYPTGIDPQRLRPKEQKVYDLIVKRFMATFAQPALRETMEVFLGVKNETFIAKGTRTLQENWHIYYRPYVKLEEITLPEMKEGEKISVKSIEKHDKETQPPNRYNQSSIIRELEKRNLGTKATRADILDRLFQRGYIEGVKIIVSKLGMETIKILEKHAPTIIDEKLTADFELDMEKIREGKEKPETVLEKAKKFLTHLLSDFKKKEKDIGAEIIKSIRETEEVTNFVGPCPKCGKGRLMIKRGKFGRFIGCDKYPKCKTILNVPKFGKIVHTEKQCEICKFPIIEIGSGRSRRTGCINKECSSKLGSETGKDGKPVKYKSQNFKEEGMTCPTCKEGKMVLRKSFYGEFLGCNNYPRCQTIMKISQGKVDVNNPIVKKPAENGGKKEQKKENKTMNKEAKAKDNHKTKKDEN